MKALVTGAAGFVGGHVSRVLVDAGHEVRALTRSTSNTAMLDGLDVEMVQGDITDLASIEKAMEGCEAVFHVAALNALWHRDPSTFYRTNVEGTRNVLAAALAAGVQRVVHTSTWAVIGCPAPGSLADETTVALPRDLSGLYRQTKHLAELEVQAFLGRGLDVVVVNPTVVVGPGDAKPTPTGRMVQDFVAGRMPFFVTAHLNLVDVDDVAVGHLLAWEKGKSGERYILGNRNMTLGEMLGVLATIAGRRPPRWRLPLWLVAAAAYADEWVEGRLLRREPQVPMEAVRHTQGYRAVDCSKAVRELGLPQSSVAGALERAVRWFRDSRASAAQHA